MASITVFGLPETLSCDHICYTSSRCRCMCYWIFK